MGILKIAFVFLLATIAVTAVAADPALVTDAQLAGLKAVDEKTPATLGKDNKKLLYFWATWCPTCRQKLQNGELAALDAAPGIDVIAVNTDKEAARTANYLEKHKPTVAVARDPGKAILDPLKVSAVPYWVVVERDAQNKGWKIVAAEAGGELPKIRKALALE